MNKSMMKSRVKKFCLMNKKISRKKFIKNISVFSIGMFAFSNMLFAAEKGLLRLFNGIKVLNNLKSSGTSSVDISLLKSKCDDAMNDDLNTPIVLSHLFDAVKLINATHESKHSLSNSDIELLKKLFNKYVKSIFGLHPMEKESTTSELNSLMNLMLEIRSSAKQNKNWGMADQIRDGLNKLNIEIKDTKDGSTWDYKK